MNRSRVPTERADVIRRAERALEGHGECAFVRGLFACDLRQLLDFYVTNGGPNGTAQAGRRDAVGVE